MPVEIVWDNDEHTILRHIYLGEVTHKDYMLAIEHTEEYVEQVTHTVHVIMDRSGLRSHPSSMSTVLRYANRKIPANLGLRIIVKPSLFTKLMVDIGQLIAPKLVRNVHYVNTVSQAYELIARHNQDLAIKSNNA